MIKCKHCDKVIEMGSPYISLLFIGDFCSKDCLDGFINADVEKAGVSYVKEECEHCYNCHEHSEHSMFGSSTTRKCKLDESVDCEDIEGCKKFIYGEPEKYDFTYNRDGGKEVVEEAVKYESSI